MTDELLRQVSDTSRIGGELPGTIHAEQPDADQPAQEPEAFQELSVEPQVPTIPAQRNTGENRGSMPGKRGSCERRSFLELDETDIRMLESPIAGKGIIRTQQSGKDFQCGGDDLFSSDSGRLNGIGTRLAEVSGALDNLRIHVWIFLEEPWHTWQSSVLSGAMVAVIAFSIIHSTLFPSQEAPSDQLSLACNLIFCADVLFRIWCSPVRLRFLWQPKNVVDTLSIVPFFLNEVLQLPDLAPSLFGFLWKLSAFEAFLRLLKLSRYFWGWQLLFRALTDSAKALVVPLFFLMLIVYFGSCLLFVSESLESIQEDMGAATLSAAVHFSIECVLSMSTGPFYGMRAGSSVGRAIACTLMLAGMLFMAMPIAIVGTCFSQTWFDRDRIALVQKVRARLAAQGYTHEDLHEAFEEVDVDGSGHVDLEEFRRMIDLLQLRTVNMTQGKIQDLFQCFDCDCDGLIGFRDFALALFPELPADYYDDYDGVAASSMVPASTIGDAELRNPPVARDQPDDPAVDQIVPSSNSTGSQGLQMARAKSPSITSKHVTGSSSVQQWGFDRLYSYRSGMGGASMRSIESSDGKICGVPSGPHDSGASIRPDVGPDVDLAGEGPPVPASESGHVPVDSRLDRLDGRLERLELAMGRLERNTNMLVYAQSRSAGRQGGFMSPTPASLPVPGITISRVPSNADNQPQEETSRRGSRLSHVSRQSVSKMATQASEFQVKVVKAKSLSATVAAAPTSIFARKPKRSQTPLPVKPGNSGRLRAFF